MWYYTLNGQQAGPVDQAELAQMLNGTLSADTLVWKEGMADWLPARGVDAFSNIEATQAPASASGRTINPYAAPSTAADQNMLLSDTDEIPAEPIPLDIGFCISKSWKTTISCFGTIFLTWFVYILMSSIVGGVLSSIGSAIDGPSVVTPNHRLRRNDTTRRIYPKFQSESKSAKRLGLNPREYLKSGVLNVPRPRPYFHRAQPLTRKRC